jgi:hypothetical protein
MEQRFIHLVWHDVDNDDPVFLCAFNTRAEATDYARSLQENPSLLFQGGLHPANIRISIVSYGKK